MDYKWYAALAYVRANKLNHNVIATSHDRFGIIASGNAFNDTRQALADLGLDDDTCRSLGIRLHKVNVVWPLEATITRDFATGLRHVLRQDPDVLMVGEIRDAESMDIALKAANTGHLVFATLHTTDAVQTIQRILTFFPPERSQEIRSLLAENLQGVISLRLIRTANGKARVPACEIMVTTEAIRDFLHSGDRPAKIAELIAEGGVQYGMQSFDQSLMQLYQEGEIDQEEALANATNRSEFALKLRGIEGTSGRVWVDA